MSHTLPPPQSAFIWYSAWLSLPVAIYAAKSKHGLAIIPVSVFTTSILYWKDPVRDSWRRTLDITVVTAGLTYNSYYAFKIVRNTSPKHFAYYTALIAASGGCYIAGVLLMDRGCIWPATYAHASIHLIANIANMVLYRGIR